jgi:hypothetical protein
LFKVTKNLVFHDRSKHIEMKYHFIKDMVQRHTINLQYIRTDEQIADILTKPLSLGKFVYFRDKLGMAKNVSLTEGIAASKDILQCEALCVHPQAS